MAGFQIITPTKLGQLSIGTSNTPVYAVLPKTVVYLKDIDIPNNLAVPIAVTVYIGNGTAQSNVLIPNVTIPGNSIFQWTGTQILNAGDTIVAVASAAGCNIIASGAVAI